MTDLPLHLISENTKTIVFGWTPIACEGYEFVADGRRVSNTWDPNTSQVKFGKVASGRYEVRALGIVAVGKWPTVAPPSGLGANIGLPPAPLPGTPTVPRTTADLYAAIQAATAGSVIDLGGATLDLQGGTVYLTKIAGGRAELRNGRVINGGPDSNIRAQGSAANWTVRSIASDRSAASGFKITDDTNAIWLVDTTATDNQADGYSTSQRAANWDMWNPRSIHNGYTPSGAASSLNQGFYIGGAKGTCRVINPYCDDNAGYAFQVQYPQVESLLVSCPEFAGGPHTVRGGLVLSESCSNVRVVAPYIHGTVAGGACHVNYGNTVYACVVASGYQQNNDSGWNPGPGVSYPGCKTGPAGPIDPALYADVCALDINYTPRPAAPKAGCFA